MTKHIYCRGLSSIIKYCLKPNTVGCPDEYESFTRDARVKCPGLQIDGDGKLTVAEHSLTIIIISRN